jgi:hypothetical protein
MFAKMRMVRNYITPVCTGTLVLSLLLLASPSVGISQSSSVSLFVSGEWASSLNPLSGVVYRIDPGIFTVRTRVARLLESPLDGVCGPDGYIYFADFGANSIIRFKPDGSNRQSIGRINHPTALAFGPEGDLFVNASGGIWKIEFERGIPKQPEQIIPRFSKGISVIGAIYSISENIGGIAFLPDRTMLVVDTPGNLVFRFAPPDFAMPEVFITSYTDDRGRTHELSTPVGIAVNNKGEIFIADANERHIIKFSSRGEFEKILPGHQYIPLHLEFDSVGNLYVTNWGLYVGEGDVVRIPPAQDRIEFITALTDAWGLAVCSPN